MLRLPTSINDVLEKINYEDIIEEFITKKNSRQMMFSVEPEVSNTFPIFEFMFDIFLYIVWNKTYLTYIFDILMSENIYINFIGISKKN